MTRPEVEKDTAHSAPVRDHHFVEKEGAPWERCQYEGCKLARSAHAYGPIPDTDPGRPESMRWTETPHRVDVIDPPVDSMRPIADHADQFGGLTEPPPLPDELQKCLQYLGPTSDGQDDMFCFMDPDHTEIHGLVAKTGKELFLLAQEHAPLPQVGDRIGNTVVVGVDEDTEVPSRDEIIQKEGHKDDGGKTPFFYLPWDALEDVAYVMEYGAKKYAAGNYRKGMQASRLFSACIRHMVAWWRGEDNDVETDRPHAAHAVCCILMLMETVKIGTGSDDRYANRYADTLE